SLARQDACPARICIARCGQRGSPMFKRSPLILLIVPIVLSVGCGGAIQQVQIVRTVEQTALVPTPAGPHASGRIVESGKFLFEGGYSGNAVFATGDSRYEGESGNVFINHGLRGRFSAGLG